MPDTPTTSQTPPEQDEILLQWQAPATPEHERSKRWYVIGGSILLIVAIYSLFAGSWPLSIVCVLIGVVYYLLRDHTPHTQQVRIIEQGVFVDERFVRWEDLAGFWVMESGHYNMLHLLKKGTRADIAVQTGSADITTMRTIIAQFIPEETEKKENFFDTLTRVLEL